MDHQSIHERFAAAKTFLGEGRRILISGHRSPDGDALGSMIALARMLRAAGHDAVATADVRALDDHDAALGIELVPCLETLGHLEQICRWAASMASMNASHSASGCCRRAS